MINFSDAQKEVIKRQYDLLQQDVMTEREHGCINYSERDDFHRDYTRILYSSSFRRLQGKMQILGVESSAFFRNRLTHSLEVSQIAHSIASAVGKECDIYKDDLFLIEAAALAHDIGHPAFGHKGERVLNELSVSFGYRFEGNAQNFRVLRTLEKKEPTFLGLNLTNRTLLAINKYLVHENPYVSKFLFSDDYDYLEGIRSKTNLKKTRTLDVQIIEIADDIAYAVHDLEDALGFRYFSIDELLYQIKDENEDSYNKLKGFVDEAKQYAMTSSSYHTIQEYSQVFRKRLTSKLTYEFVNDITLAEVVDNKAILEHGTEIGQQELQMNEYKNLCGLLSKTIYNCVTRDPDVTLYECKGEVVLRSLFEILSDEKTNKGGKLLPPDYRPHDKYPLQKGCIDYLAGMMDTFAISQYEKLCGKSFDEIVIKG
jgi:dGTPase